MPPIKGNGLGRSYLQFPNLEYLDVYGCVWLTLEGFSEVVRMSGNLLFFVPALCIQWILGLDGYVGKLFYVNSLCL